MSYVNDTKPTTSYSSPDNKPSTSFSDDSKPVYTALTWASITTTWASEQGTWISLIGTDYVNDSEPS